MKRVSTLLALAATLLTAPAAAMAQTVVYQNNFQADANGFTFTGGDPNASPTRITAPNGTQNFIGNLTQGGTATLNLTGLAPSTAVFVSFNLYAIRSLDGDGQSGGGAGDPFSITLNGATIFNQTFANARAASQSYPNTGSPAGTGRDATQDNALGYTFPANPNGVFAFDTAYNITLTSAGVFTGPLTLAFIGNSTQDTSDEFYGIDNLTVRTSAVAVPGPVAGAGLVPLLGLAGGWFARRRRRRAPAA